MGCIWAELIRRFIGDAAGLTSLLVGTQPVMTVLLLVIMTPQRFTVSQWIGLGIGFVGISLVLLGNLEWQSEEKQWAAVGMCLLSLFGITVGTLYQKRFCQQSDSLGNLGAIHGGFHTIYSSCA